MQNSPRSFLIAFVSTGTAIALSILAINIAIDPFRIFDLVNIEGVNTQRLQAASESRMFKAVQVCIDKPTAVVMGTSRVEVGIDPRHPGWADGKRVYNLGLAGIGLYELNLTLRHLVHASPNLKQVAIGFDFLMFNANREDRVFGTEVLGFDKERLLTDPDDNCYRSVLHDAKRILGLSALKYSIATVRGQLNPPDSAEWKFETMGEWIAQYDRLGYRGNYYSALKRLMDKFGARNNFDSDNNKPAAQETYYVGKIWRPSPTYRYCFESPQGNSLDVYRSMLDFSYRSNVDVRFFINPIHARHVIAIREAGLWPVYEEWKRNLVTIIEEEAATKGRRPFPIWDFSGFNSITTEFIPEAGVLTPKVNFWWESSHYQSLPGAMILDRVLEHVNLERNLPSDFGILLGSANIERWLLETRQGANAYAKAQPHEAQVVKSAVDSAMDGEEGANCGLDVQTLHEGMRLKEVNDEAGADELFDRAIKLHEASRELYTRLNVPFREAGFFTLLQKMRTGERIFRRLGSAVEYQDRGTMRMAEDDYTGAIEDYTAAYKITPYNDALKFLIGSAHLPRGKKRLAVGDLSGADLDFTTTIDLWQSTPQSALFFLRGSTRLRLGEEEAAIVDFNAGLDLDPTNATLLQLREDAKSLLETKSQGKVRTESLAPTRKIIH